MEKFYILKLLAFCRSVMVTHYVLFALQPVGQWPLNTVFETTNKINSVTTKHFINIIFFLNTR